MFFSLVSAGGPGDCDFVTASASIFEEGETNLENFISIESDKQQKAFDDAKASGLTKEQFKNILIQLNQVAKDEYISMIQNIAINLEAVTGVPKDEIFGAILTNDQRGRLSCLSTQLAQLTAKIFELVQLYNVKGKELLDSY